MATEVPEDHKRIARRAAETFGGQPRVIVYRDDNDGTPIPIAIAADTPQTGVTSAATIGISDFLTGYTLDEKPIGSEIIGAAYTAFDFFPAAIYSCAFNVINLGYKLFPGAVYSNIFPTYSSELTMKHVLFGSPFLWGEGPEELYLDSKVVTWLMAIPVSDQEKQFRIDHGYDALDRLLGDKQIDIFNLNRASCL